MSDMRTSIIIGAVDRATAPIKRLTAATRRLEEQAAASRQNMDRALATSANLNQASQSAFNVGHAALNFLKGPLEAAAEFEEAIGKVGAVARATDAQMKTLTAEARRLGATTSFSASEAAQGMEYLAMAGFNTNQIVAAMPGMLDLAKASATDLGRTADIASDILSGFGLKADQMGHVGDVLTAAFTSSNTNLEMLGETMKYVAPVARSLGVSLEESAAMSGLLANVGVKASQAGTTMRAMFTRLAAPVGGATKALKSIGVQVKDAEGNMRPVIDILADMEKGMAGLGSAERAKILKKVFGDEAMAGATELIEQMSEGKAGIAKYAQELQNATGIASQTASRMGDNARGVRKEWGSAVESLYITFGNLLLPALKAGTRLLTSIVRRVESWAAANPGLAKAVGFVVAGVGILAVLLGGLLTAMAAVTAGAAVLKFGMIGLAQGGIKAVIMGMRSMTVAMMSNPIGLIVGAIAIAAGLIIYHWDKIGPFFQRLWGTVKNLFAQAIAAFIDDPFILHKKLWEMGKLAMEGLKKGILGALGAVKEAISNVAGSVVGKFKGLLGIKSPSRVFAGLGQMLGQGLAVGMDDSTAPVQRAAGSMATTAMGAVGGAKRPGGAVQATGLGGPTVNITVNAAAGADGEDIAKKVRAEIDAFFRQQAARARGAMHDGGMAWGA